jgi:diguanylate cyclase (GGDEF)-like protein
VGGDEFVLLLAKVPPDDAPRVVRTLQRSLATPLRIDGHGFGLQASFGVAHHPRDGVTLDALLSHADRAMYREKVVRRLRHQLRTA